MIKKMLFSLGRIALLGAWCIFAMEFVLAPVYSDAIAVKYINIKDYAKYTLPLKDAVGDNYCSSSAVSFKGEVYTVTNNHCCNYGLTLFGDKEIRVGNTIENVIFQSNLHDVCILTSKFETSPITLAEEPLDILDKVLVMGYPRGGYLTPRWGHVLAKDVEVCISEGIEEDCALSNFLSTITYGGNSGSPVLTVSGQLANLIYAGNSFIHTYGISVPHIYIKDALNEAHSKSN